MTAHDLKDLAAMGVEIGNHTDTHVHCRSLTPAEHDSEIIASKARLEELSGQKVRSFSVPYGSENDLTNPLLETLRASGHEAIFLVQARSNTWRPAPDVWYRTSLHNETPSQLKRHMVHKPFLRSVKHKLTG
jgi:peptidoglycan/xylan/chitin deacetylase (PgdA/CDA1 family)